MSASGLGRRKERIRLSQKDIVRLTGLDKTTVNHVLNGKSDPLASTIERIDRAITGEELALRDYLLRLHPIADRDSGEPLRVPSAIERVAA